MLHGLKRRSMEAHLAKGVWGSSKRWVPCHVTESEVPVSPPLSAHPYGRYLQ